MDLRSWIVGDLQSSLQRLGGGVLGIIPPDRRRETVDGGGIPPIYVLWHMTRHHDLAINRVLRGVDEVVEQHTDSVGVDERLWRGLSEGADLDLVQVLDPEAVGAYCVATIEETIAWVSGERPDSLDLGTLDDTPDATAALAGIGTPEDDFDWIYSMWDGKPASWFLSWEGIGHVVTHTGELVSIRNRMGLSPF